ncbi:hypothetical protein ALC53_01040, partial [Atta colombica]
CNARSNFRLKQRSSKRIAERSDAARLTGDDRMTAAAIPSS